MLELGMTFSYAQLVIDNEIAKMIKKVLQGIMVNDDTLAVDVIKQVGAGGDFLMQQHTIERMKSEQSQSKLFDRKMRDNWLSEGGKDVATKANDLAIHILQNHKPEALPANVISGMRSIVESAEEDFRKK